MGSRHRKKHPEFYFDDGSIVLSVPSSKQEVDVLFRIHKSILRRESTIFADMFDIPTPPPEETELYESVPLVNLQDSAEDWGKLLDMQYNPHSFVLRRHHPGTVLQVDGVLKLATKYEMTDIRRRIVSHIEEDWPTTLEEWDALQEKAYAALQEAEDNDTDEEFYDGDFLPEPISTIQLARKYNITSVLRAAYYMLSTIDNSRRNQDKTTRWADLSAREWWHLYSAMQDFQEQTYNLLIAYNQDWLTRCDSSSAYCRGLQCSDIMESRYAAESFEGDYIFKTQKDPLQVLKRYQQNEERFIGKLCHICRLQCGGSKILALRNNIWDMIDQSFNCNVVSKDIDDCTEDLDLEMGL